MQLKVTKTQARKLGVAALLVAAIIVAGYTVTAHVVASHIVEVNGTPMWATAPRGSLFPLPSLPGNLLANISLLQTDLAIYTYLIKTYVLAAVTMLLWAAFIWTAWKLRRRKTKKLR